MNHKWLESWDDVYNKEYKVTAQWKKFITSITDVPDLFIDVGPGRIGSEAWEVNTTFPECIIRGYEPQIERYEILKEASYPGDLSKFVISDVDGLVGGFSGHPEGKSDFWLYGGDSVKGAYKEVTLPSRRLDTLFFDSKFKSILIWADIEGSELDILKGATKLLQSGRILGLNLELRKVSEAPGACTASEIVSFLSDYEYFPTEDVISLDHITHKDFIFIKSSV